MKPDVLNWPLLKKNPPHYKQKTWFFNIHHDRSISWSDETSWSGSLNPYTPLKTRLAPFKVQVDFPPAVRLTRPVLSCAPRWRGRCCHSPCRDLCSPGQGHVGCGVRHDQCCPLVVRNTLWERAQYLFEKTEQLKIYGNRSHVSKRQSRLTKVTYLHDSQILAWIFLIFP